MTSNSHRKKAIFLMVLIQLVPTSFLLFLLSPVTFAPSSSIDTQRVIILPVYTNDTTPVTSIGEIRDRMEESMHDCGLQDLSP